MIIYWIFTQSAVPLCPPEAVVLAQGVGQKQQEEDGCFQRFVGGAQAVAGNSAESLQVKSL